MRHHDMIQSIGADMPARYTVDGRRVSKETYNALMDTAHSLGTVECLWTKGRQVTGGRIRRTNGCAIRVPEKSDER